MVFTFSWKIPDGSFQKCPMHEDPLQLAPLDLRPAVLAKLNRTAAKPTGGDDPRRACARSAGRCTTSAWPSTTATGTCMLEDVKVYRLILSEQDRIGIGTFQPKDEKNQDSTELTGDINYRKIAEYGTDSDPRCRGGRHDACHRRGPCGLWVDCCPRPAAGHLRAPARWRSARIGNSRASASPTASISAESIPLRTLVTRLGYRLRGTPNHMVLTLTPEGEPAWKELRLLEIGDYVALGRGVHTWSGLDRRLPRLESRLYGNERHHPRFPERMSPALARFLGLWIGDGHFYVEAAGHQYEFGWTQKEPERCQEFAQLLADLFGVQPHFSAPEDHAGACWSVAAPWSLAARGRWPEGGRLRQGDSRMRSALDARVRPRLLARAMGNRRHGTGERLERGYVRHLSETLARQVQTILLAFGIVSSLKRSPRTGKCGFTVTMSIGSSDPLPSLRDRFTVARRPHAQAAAQCRRHPVIKPKLRTIVLPSAIARTATRYSGNLHDTRKPNVSYTLLRDFLNEVRTRGRRIAEAPGSRTAPPVGRESRLAAGREHRGAQAKPWSMM